MEIKGKVHCFFEQSGTFKNEFIKLGIPAEDYDIQNNFGQTDHTNDLFAEIENAYGGGQSVFDNITKDDLIVAFFPCIYFSCLSQMAMTWGCVNYRKKTVREATDLILERTKDREKFYTLAIKMLTVAQERGLRLIMENPWSMQTYLKANFVLPPALIDHDRSLRGDHFKKETAYWYINCEPTHGKSFQPAQRVKVLDKKGATKGTCSEERSMISPDYARNFICDFILGKEQQHTERSLFDI
jgi:hypothetical protein